MYLEVKLYKKILAQLNIKYDLDSVKLKIYLQAASRQYIENMSF